MVDAEGVHVGGDGDGPAATVTVHDPQTYVDIFRGSIGVGESYFRGLWDTDDLVSVLRVLLRSTGPYDRLERLRTSVAERSADALRSIRGSDPQRDRHNVRAHYDLGNPFFELFLDETMSYSCGIFTDAETTLAQASRAKIDQICRQLGLGPDDHLLEIGTGWGGFAEHAAARYGCRVTTTTISHEQHAYAAKRIHNAGLADRVTVLDRHFRELDGTFDKAVSVEMIEAVPWWEYDDFFATCSARLRPGGAMVLQAILLPDHRFDQRKRRDDFVKRYIFPEGCLPSMAAIRRSLDRATDLRVEERVDIGDHYGETLARWRCRLADRHEEALALGLTPAFLRMWEFYLAICEAGFRERHLHDVQLLLTRPA